MPEGAKAEREVKEELGSQHPEALRAEMKSPCLKEPQLRHRAPAAGPAQAPALTPTQEQEVAEKNLNPEQEQE